MYQQTKTTKEKLRDTIRQARIDADTAQRIIKALDRWGTKLFNKRFADALQAELGKGYEVYYSKSYGDWRLTVRTTEQGYNEGVSISLGERPTAVRCRERAEGYAASLESDHIRAALFEVADYGEICAEAARIAVETRDMKAKYGKYNGDFTPLMREEVKRILTTA